MKPEKSISIENKKEEMDIHPSVKKLMGIVKLPKNFNYEKSLIKAIQEKYKF